MITISICPGDLLCNPEFNGKSKYWLILTWDSYFGGGTFLDLDSGQIRPWSHRQGQKIHDELILYRDGEQT